MSGPIRETIFQGAERKINEWNGISEPQERPVYRSERDAVSVLVDPYARMRLGLVAYAHRPTEHLNELTPYEYLRLRLVTHFVGAKMLRVARVEYPDLSEQRTLERVDGFMVPDHAHIVLGVGTKGEEPAIATPDSVRRTWELLVLTGEEQRELGTELENRF